jgi:hypothetical protein
MPRRGTTDKFVEAQGLVEQEDEDEKQGVTPCCSGFFPICTSN